jgi:acyl-CoA thioesterase
VSFSDATAVTRVGPGVYRGEIDTGWDIFGVTNGGYLLAMAARALVEEGGGRLVSITGRFVNPAGPGPVEIGVETVKRGRSLTILNGLMADDERPLVTFSASLANSGEGPGPISVTHGEPPSLPPPEDCPRLVPSKEAPLPPPFAGKVECRLHPDDTSLGVDRPGPPQVRGWFGLDDGEMLDPAGLVLASDGFPPAIFFSSLPIGWTPTVDLTVHVRDPGPHRWVACRFTTRFVTGGWLEEDGEMWSQDGRLVAQSRQLALVSR